MKIGFVACGVLEAHVRDFLARSTRHQYTTRFLPAGLHANPQRLCKLLQETIDEWSAGADNARFICEFRESWKRNYRRAAYIRFPEESGTPPGETITAGTARSLNWDFEIVPGDLSLLEALLHGAWHDARLLLVPPYSKTVSAPGAEVISFCSGFDSHVDVIIERFRRQQQVAAPARQGCGLEIDTGGTFTDAVIYDFETGRILAASKAPTTHHDLSLGIRAALSKLPAETLRQARRVGLSTALATNAFVERKGRPVALLIMAPIPIPLDTLPFSYVRQLRGGMSIEVDEMTPIDPEEVIRAAREAKEKRCEAIAISGFGSVINPVHEIEAARLAFETSGLPTVC